MNPTVIITGATGSMGSAAVRQMAAQGFDVVLACRNTRRGEDLKNELLSESPDGVQLHVMMLDLSSLVSVKSFANKIGAYVHAGKIHLVGLFNNAGTMNRHYSLTDDGLENDMAVNCVGAYVLTRCLLPYFAPDACVVDMVSVTCHINRLHADFLHEPANRFRQLPVYGRSKLALLLSAVALSQHLHELGRPDLHINVADPGVVDTHIITMDRWFDSLADVVFRPLIKRPEQGVAPALKALVSDKRLYYFVGKKARPIRQHYLHHPFIEEVWNALESFV